MENWIKKFLEKFNKRLWPLHAFKFILICEHSSLSAFLNCFMSNIAVSSTEKSAAAKISQSAIKVSAGRGLICRESPHPTHQVSVYQKFSSLVPISSLMLSTKKPEINVKEE